MFIGAFIAEGLFTSLMLIAAVPPLVTGWPVGKMPWTGMRDVTWICLAIAGGGGLSACSLFIAGRGRLQTPDLDRWTGGEPAWESPPLFARLRHSPDRTTILADEPAQGPASSDERAA